MNKSQTTLLKKLDKFSKLFNILRGKRDFDHFSLRKIAHKSRSFVIKDVQDDTYLEMDVKTEEITEEYLSQLFDEIDSKKKNYIKKNDLLDFFPGSESGLWLSFGLIPSHFEDARTLWKKFYLGVSIPLPLPPSHPHSNPRSLPF